MNNTFCYTPRRGGGSSAPTLPAGQLRLAGREYYQVVSNSATSTATTIMQGGWWHEMQAERGNILELRATAVGHYILGATGYTALGKTYTYKVSVYVIYRNTLIAYPTAITWAGATSIGVTSGMAMQTSDDWVAANSQIPAGARVFFYYELTTPTSGIITIYTRSAIGNNSAIPFATRNYSYAATPPSDIYTQIGGVVNVTGGTSVSSNPVGLWGILARHQYDHTAAFVGGDSRVAGDTGTTNDKVNGRSPIWRVLNDWDIPIHLHAVGGSTLQIHAAVDVKAYAMTAYCQWAFIKWGVNDIAVNSRSLANMQTDFGTLITKLKTANPTLKVVWGLEYPETDDTASTWLSTATQGPRFGDAARFGPSGTLAQWNAWLLTRVGIELQAVWDTRDLVESGGAGTSSLWKSATATQAFTADGIHINDVGASYEVGMLKTQLLAMGVVPNNGST